MILSRKTWWTTQRSSHGHEELLHAIKENSQIQEDWMATADKLEKDIYPSFTPVANLRFYYKRVRQHFDLSPAPIGQLDFIRCYTKEMSRLLKTFGDSEWQRGFQKYLLPIVKESCPDLKLQPIERIVWGLLSLRKLHNIMSPWYIDFSLALRPSWLEIPACL